MEMRQMTIMSVICLRMRLGLWLVWGGRWRLCLGFWLLLRLQGSFGWLGRHSRRCMHRWLRCCLRYFNIRAKFSVWCRPWTSMTKRMPTLPGQTRKLQYDHRVFGTCDMNVFTCDCLFIQIIFVPMNQMCSYNLKWTRNRCCYGGRESVRAQWI